MHIPRANGMACFADLWTMTVFTLEFKLEWMETHLTMAALDFTLYTSIDHTHEWSYIVERLDY